MLFGFQQSQTATAGSLALFAPKTQISSQLPVFGSVKTILTWILSLSLYLIHFITFFAKSPHFCFVRSLTISFAIDGTEFRDTDVVVSFPKWFL